MREAYVAFLNQWERNTIRACRRARWALRIVLVVIGVSWALNVWGAVTTGSWWHWAAVVLLPYLGILNVRSTRRLQVVFDDSLLSIEAARVRGEREHG